MSSERSLRTIFDGALERENPIERARYLDEACGADVALRERIEKLLRAHDEAGGFLAQPSKPSPASLPTAALALPVTEKAGDTIGRYKLLQQIGEGGCGVVYMAEQTVPVRRCVALKVIKLGMDTKQVIARFEAERQALAMMDHPNIARVLDAGATETGRPYFVMELVRGTKITEFCDQKELSPHDRLELFIPVCQAVQHAHQKGIIHRDLKPSNILVTIVDGKPVPKVIDFGIAKATNNQRLTDMTVFTAFEQFIGTPAYMSPEQAEMSGVDIDTRTDIYSLGVVLYELLTGKTPFDAEQLLRSGIDEIRRTIREREPPKPSTRLNGLSQADLTTTAHARQTDPPKLIHTVRGDLDWIVMKCLEKDRARRYETANGLARDIERHLNCEPVVARPPSRLYEFQKTVRRHKFGFASAAALIIVLAGGALVSTWQAVRATKAEREQSRLRERAEANEKRAETEATKSRQVATFLQDMLKGVGPSVALGRDTTMLREILDKTEERLVSELADQPEVKAELLNTIGFAYWELGEHEKSEAVYRQSLELMRKARGNEHQAVADVLHNLTETLRRRGKASEAEATGREATAIYQKLFGREHPTVGASLNSLAFTLPLDRLEEAEALLRDALGINRKTLGEEHPQVGLDLSRLGRVLQAQGKPTESESVLRDAVTIQRKALGQPVSGLNPHVELGWTLYYLAEVIGSQSRWAEAETISREASTIMRKVLGEGHPDVSAAFGQWMATLASQGKLAEAEAVGRELLATRKRVLRNERPDSIGIVDRLVILLLRQDKYTEAEALCREHLANQQSPGTVSLVCSALEREGKFSEAESLSREAVAVNRKLHGDEHQLVAQSLRELGTLLRKGGKLVEAEAAHREALELRRKLHPDAVGISLKELGAVLAAEGKLVEAETMYREALAVFRKFTDEHLQVRQMLKALVQVLERQGKKAEAEPLCQEYRQLTTAQNRKLLEKGGPPALNDAAWRLATSANPMDRDSASAIALAEKAVSATSRKDATYLDTLAAAFAEAGDFAKALSVQKEAMALLSDEKQKEEFASRLKLYETNTPYREGSPTESP